MNLAFNFSLQDIFIYDKFFRIWKRNLTKIKVMPENGITDFSVTLWLKRNKNETEIMLGTPRNCNHTRWIKT